MIYIVAVLFSVVVLGLAVMCFKLALEMWNENIPGAPTAALLGVFIVAFYLHLWL